MQIAARRIDPERPSRHSRLFPGGERQRILEELRDRDPVQPPSGDATDRERGLIARLWSRRQMIEWEPGGTLESAERIGLCLPVHVAESRRKLEWTVLRSLVVRECDVQVRGSLLRSLAGSVVAAALEAFAAVIQGVSRVCSPIRYPRSGASRFPSLGRPAKMQRVSEVLQLPIIIQWRSAVFL